MKTLYFSRILFFAMMFTSCSDPVAEAVRAEPDRFIHGTVSAGYEPVRTAFTENFLKGKETGAALCVYVKGEKVVDLWGGFRDKERTQAWQENTMTLVYSMTKGLASLCIAKLHSDSLIDYDALVRTYWPHFTGAGKESLTVRQLLSHQSGLCLWEGSVPVRSLNDTAVMLPKLEGAVPRWTPGERSGYSAGMVGAYLRELVRRCDRKHRSLGRYFQEEIAHPVGAEFYIGLPDSIPNERIAYNTVLGVPQRLASMFKLPWGMFTTVINPWSIFIKSISQVEGYDVNGRETWRIEEPSGNGIGTARAAAAIYSDCANGGMRIGLTPHTLGELTANGLEPTGGAVDMVMGIPMHYRSGFLKNGAEDHPFENRESFGFGGASGSMAFADPVHHVGYCYIPTMMGDDFPDSRNETLQRVVYSCIKRIESSDH